MTLDLNGRADLVYLGTIGAVSGRFVLDAHAGQFPEMWGVMKLDTNFEKLRPMGVEADLFAMLQINTSKNTHIETLTLPGQAEGGGDLTETYVLAPELFRIEAAGKLILHVPDWNYDAQFGLELFRLSGAFSFEVSSRGLQILAKADVEIGPRDVRLFDFDALGVLIINDQEIGRAHV